MKPAFETNTAVRRPEDSARAAHFAYALHASLSRPRAKLPWKARAANGRIWVGWLTAVLSVPSGLWLLHTESLWVAYAMNFVFALVSPLWLGAGASAVNELVLPRLRALASAFYLLLITFIGLALGPYTMGKLSDVLVEMPEVAEGARTCLAVPTMAARAAVEAPIAEAVVRVLYEDVSPREAIERLMTRALRPE